MTVLEWTSDNAAHLAAALAYYTIFSLVPLLVIALSLAGLVLGREVARGQLTDQVQAYTRNPSLADLVYTLADNAATPGASLAATIVGFLVLLYGATGVFAELKNALNHIWDAPTKHASRIWAVVLGRLVALLMVVVSGLLMLASLVVTAVLSAATDWVNLHWPGMALTTQVVNFVFFYIVTGIVFALVYKFVPDVRIAWRDVLIGAVATALLFSIGRLLISVYLTRTPIASLYGAAGSLIVLLLWTYYSAQVFFLGAEFTQVYARTYGSRQQERPILPDEALATELSAEELAGLAGQSPAADQDATKPAAVQRPASRLGRWGRAVGRPVADIGIALGIIALVSVYNLLREPFRKT